MHSVYIYMCFCFRKKDYHPHPYHSASYNIVPNQHHHHCHHHHCSTSCNVCIQYMRHCSRKITPPVQVTVRLASASTLQTTTCAREYMCSMVEDNVRQRKLQRIRTCITTVGVHDAASTCNLRIRACH